MTIQETLSGKKHAQAHLGSVLLLGLGVSGKAVHDYCLPLIGNRISSLCVLTGTEESGFNFYVTREEGATQQEFLQLSSLSRNFDVCIVSPGISQFSALYKKAQACSNELISEVEFAWRESAADSIWVAITGTNGKTTTTALTAYVLQQAGFAAKAVGNIGDTCIQAVADGQTKVYIAEVSSYQLASTRYFAPDVAIMLGITPDHLAWHKSFDAYVEAKKRVFANIVGKEKYVVLDASNEVVRGIIGQLRAEGCCSLIPVGTGEGVQGDMRACCGSENAAFVRKDHTLVVALGAKDYEFVQSQDLQLRGNHNLVNTLMAASTALVLGASVEAIRAGLRSFVPLPHRLEPCGSVNGVSCYNDSKATNVDATLVALRSFAGESLVVLLGGDDKGTNLDELVALAEQTCKAVVCFGVAGPRFYQAFEGSQIPSSLAKTMQEALRKALSYAVEGDIVLLSPACASFDEFDNFEHRGAVFKELVKEMQE